MPALLRSVAVTAVWGLTFVQVKDAVEIYPLFAFLARAVRDRGAHARPCPRRGGCARSAPRRVAGASLGLLLAAGYALQTAGLERTTVSSTGFITGLYVVFTPLLALRPLPDADRARGLARRRALHGRARAPHRRRRRGHGGDAARPRRLGGLLAADRADGAVRAAVRRDRVHGGGDARGVRRLRASSRSRSGRSRCRAAGRSGARSWSRASSRARSASSCRRGRSGSTSATATALAFAMEPVFAGVLRFWLAGDRLGAAGWAGCAVIMAGIVVAEPAAAETLRRLVVPRAG